MGFELDRYITTVDITVVQAMEKIDQGARGILFVVDNQRHLIGCVTDGDIRRWLIKTADLNAKIENFMSRNPKFVYSIRDNEIETYMEEYGVNALPILDGENRIKDIRFRVKKKGQKDMPLRQDLKGVPVVLMAGGKGTRLYPYTKVLPKPLIPVGEVPIIERITQSFHSYGVEDFYITVNYKKGMIRSYFEDLQPKYRIHYVEEDTPLGTGGSLKLINTSFKVPVFVSNSDILIETDLSQIYKQHLESGNQITIVSSLKKIEIPYGVLKVKEGGCIEGLEEKPHLSYFINTGMYVINPEMIKLIPEHTFFHMTDLMEKALQKGYRVGMFPISEDTFLDMGEFEEMKRMEERLEQK